MNFDVDFDRFCELLDEQWAIKGQVPSAAAKTGFFRAVEDFPLREVQAGLLAHSRDPKRGAFLPTPADVIAQIEMIVSADGRPGPEEAWALALRSRDESITIVWTAETCTAMGIAQPLLQSGDDVGARMAFKEAYIRLVAEARAQRRTLAWDVSLGYDAKERDRVLLPHVQAGRLPETLLSEKTPELGQLFLLPPPKDASEKSLQIREHALQHLAALRDKWRIASPATSRGELERERTESLKVETAKKVQDYLEGRAA